MDTPPSETVLVIGDQLADWLGYGLEEALTDTPQIGIARRVKPYAGLVRYEPRADSPDWPQAVKEVLAAEKPSAIVVMLGVNDRLPLRERIAPHPAPTGPQTPGRAVRLRRRRRPAMALQPRRNTISRRRAAPMPRAKKHHHHRRHSPCSVRVTSFTPTNGASFIPSASTR